MRTRHFAPDVPLRGDFNGTVLHPLCRFRTSVPTGGSSAGGSASQFPADSQVVKIDRYFPSSKLCSACGHKLQELKLSIRSWRCPECGALHDRGENAAINIETECLRILREPENAAGVTPEQVRTEGRGSCQNESSGQVLPGEVRSAKLNATASGTR